MHKCSRALPPSGWRSAPVPIIAGSRLTPSPAALAALAALRVCVDRRGRAAMRGRSIFHIQSHCFSLSGVFFVATAILLLILMVKFFPFQSSLFSIFHSLHCFHSSLDLDARRAIRRMHVHGSRRRGFACVRRGARACVCAPLLGNSDSAAAFFPRPKGKACAIVAPFHAIGTEMQFVAFAFSNRNKGTPAEQH